MDAGIIATRYAKAILEYATEKGQETTVYRYLQTLAIQYMEHPELRKVMTNPTVTNEKKISLILTGCGVESNDFLEKIIRMVVSQGRAIYMENIALVYDILYRKAKGIVIAKLTTIHPATDDVKKRLEEVIALQTGEQVEFHSIIDPGIIGGFIIEIDDNRLDGSVKDQLNQLRLDLTT